MFYFVTYDDTFEQIKFRLFRERKNKHFSTSRVSQLQTAVKLTCRNENLILQFNLWSVMLQAGCGAVVSAVWMRTSELVILAARCAVRWVQASFSSTMILIATTSSWKRVEGSWRTKHDRQKWTHIYQIIPAIICDASQMNNTKHVKSH